MLKSTETRYVKNFWFYDTDLMIGTSLNRYGEYGQAEIDFILSFLSKHSVVYDIGANIGYHTTAFASKASKVFAFEPHPKNFELLAKNTVDFDNVDIAQCAVSNQWGTCKINDYDENTIGNFGNVSIVDQADGIEVQTIALDTADIPPPDFIKIDVEGHELSVLEGCQNIISTRTPVVYYEAHESPHLKEIYTLLSPTRYKFYWAQINNFNPGNFKKNSDNIFGASALMSILAWPVQLPELPLTPVLGADDSVARFYVGGRP
jgi:FkbM family methyltransferase